ncbi:hypothetical protein F5Y12DRAFT_742427 [Xylaria sp. FL1777]|nr:hypothetical protein F5Y12DRAFT_742427 [Xylaria sp. FL1777]
MICPAQRDYISGTSAEPCDEIKTHTCSTIRVTQLCESCGQRKTTLDRRLSGVKTKMAELRQHLTEAYGDCVKHVYEAGLEEEANAKDGNERGADVIKIDPIQEFLRMKRNEKHSHLMMLGSA